MKQRAENKILLIDAKKKEEVMSMHGCGGDWNEPTINNPVGDYGTVKQCDQQRDGHP